MPLMRKTPYFFFTMIDSTLKQLSNFSKEKNYNVFSIWFNQTQFIFLLHRWDQLPVKCWENDMKSAF